MAAGSERMTAADPLHAEPAATDDTEAVDCLGGVMGASRLIPTVRPQVGSYQFLVNQYEPHG